MSGVPQRAHVLQEKTEERGVVLQPRQLGQDDAKIFGALGHLDPGEFLDAERVGPVVRHRAKVIEPVGVGHRAEIARVLADLLVVAMEITKDRLEFPDDFAIERHVHAKNAVGGRMLRPHRHFHQVAFEPRIHRARRRFCEFVKSGRSLLQRLQELQRLHR